MTIFNRRELSATFSMKEQARIRELLQEYKIDYKIKTVNRNSPSVFSDTRARTGTFGQNMESAYEYIFYVHKKEYENAKALISNAK